MQMLFNLLTHVGTALKYILVVTDINVSSFRKLDEFSSTCPSCKLEASVGTVSSQPCTELQKCIGHLWKVFAYCAITRFLYCPAPILCWKIPDRALQDGTRRSLAADRGRCLRARHGPTQPVPIFPAPLRSPFHIAGISAHPHHQCARSIARCRDVPPRLRPSRTNTSSSWTVHESEAARRAAGAIERLARLHRERPFLVCPAARYGRRHRPARRYQRAHPRVDLPSLLWTESRKRGVCPADFVCCGAVEQTAVLDDLKASPSSDMTFVSSSNRLRLDVWYGLGVLVELY